MTNAEKERTCALARALDRIAIPLIYAGASPNEAYRAALRQYDDTHRKN
jgi:hypothetical protein